MKVSNKKKEVGREGRTKRKDKLQLSSSERRRKEERWRMAVEGIDGGGGWRVKVERKESEKQ